MHEPQNAFQKDVFRTLFNIFFGFTEEIDIREKVCLNITS